MQSEVVLVVVNRSPDDAITAVSRTTVSAMAASEVLLEGQVSCPRAWQSPLLPIWKCVPECCGWAGGRCPHGKATRLPGSLLP